MLAISSATLHLTAHTHLIPSLSVPVRQAQVLFLPELLLPTLAGILQPSWLPAIQVKRWNPFAGQQLYIRSVCINQHGSSALNFAFPWVATYTQGRYLKYWTFGVHYAAV